LPFCSGNADHAGSIGMVRSGLIRDRVEPRAA